MSTTKKVTLARPWKGADGVQHKTDATITVDHTTADELLFLGYAREAPAAPTSRPKATPKKTATAVKTDPTAKKD